MHHALANPACWQEFYEYKQAGGHLPKEELAELEAFIQSRGYLPLVEDILQGRAFCAPRKVLLSKQHSEKKRTVYCFSPEENWVLKLLTFLLQRKYDHLFAEGLYSFRPGKSVRDAVRRLTTAENIDHMWCYKADIRNYFNTIPIPRLLPLLQTVLSDEPVIYRFLEALLSDPWVNDKGTLITEEKGIMAGTPISSFLANLYLSEMDHSFAAEGALYARYSDDIIVFAPTEESLQTDIARIHGFLQQGGLTIHPDKALCTAPGEMWTFLGIRYQQGVVDVSPVSVQKLKDKMRRKTRALVRWQARKGTTGVQAAKAFIRVFHKKLYENPISHELTWVRWYFPLITTTESLQVIDRYSQDCIRYLATGKRTKAAYNFRYQDIKALGYQSLVHSYYTPQAPSEQEAEGCEAKNTCNTETFPL